MSAYSTRPPPYEQPTAPMSQTIPHIVLTAKRLEIDELARIQTRTHLFGVVGEMIHVLQLERGASSLYLASSGVRFEGELTQLVRETEQVEQRLRQVLDEELENAAHSNAKIISLIGWVVLGLDALPELRERVRHHRLQGHASVAAFSRLIAGLIALIFELADAAVDPTISRLLVGLFNLIEGKELAGQERAVGSLAFGAGLIEGSVQQRSLHLVEAQRRSLLVFQEFSDAAIVARWQRFEASPTMKTLEQLRRRLHNARAGGRIDAELSQSWFDCCSARIGEMWSIQRELVEAMQRHCAAQIEAAEQALEDAQGLVRKLRENPPARAEAIDHFFDPDLPIEQSLAMRSEGQGAMGPAGGVIELLQAQSLHLAKVEDELAEAKRALNERKVIERAKGILMARMNISEAEAHKQMRKLAMDKNQRLVEVGQTVLKIVGHP